MPIPTWVTNENIRFDGNLEPVATLSNDAGIKQVIIWDNINISKQEILTELVDDYGGVIPLAGAVAGSQRVKLGGTTIGSDATGLSNDSDTSGFAIINIGGNKVGTSDTGLTTSSGTAGTQIVDYLPTIIGSNASGLLDDVPATSGLQIANVGGAITGASVTGLLNDATVYTASIVVDGGSVQPIAITGSAAQTYATLLGELNLDIIGASVAIVAGNLEFTSTTSGILSTIVVTDTDLFATLPTFVSLSAAVNGAAIVVTNYTAIVTIDGIPVPIAIIGNTALTFDLLVTQLNADLGVNASAEIIGGIIKISSKSVGLTSTVTIAPGTLFPATNNYQGVLVGSTGSGTGTVYSALIGVDGNVPISVNFTGATTSLLADVVTELNVDLAGIAVVSIDAGNILITSATTGTNSSISVFDTGGLFGSMIDFTYILSQPGLEEIIYQARVNVDGSYLPLVVLGTAAQTFSALITEIGTDLGGVATIALLNGDLIITSATTGVTSTVNIEIGTLFKALNGFFNMADPKEGATNIIDVMKTNRSPNGETLFNYFPIQTIPVKPPVPIGVQHTTSFIYFNGTDWLYLDDDTPV